MRLSFKSGGKIMSKKGKMVKSILVSAVAISAVAPVVASADEVKSVIPVGFYFEVDGVYKEVSYEIFANEKLKVLMGGTSDLIEYLKGDSENVTPVAFNMGGKVVSYTEYATAKVKAVMNNTEITVEDIAELEDYQLPENVERYEDGKWVVDETPEENLNETFFYNLVA